MKYEKPQIVVLESACVAVQSITKFSSNADLSNHPSVTAYEADE